MSEATSKAEVRRRLREELVKLSPAERARQSVELCSRLRAQPIWTEARSVLFFVPTREEPDIWPLVSEALANGRSIVLPRYSPAEEHYVACRIREVPRDLQAGQFGIPEPTAACSVFDLKQLDLALIPGIGFTLDGGRLGRGKGYYDRLLAGIPGLKCGVAFDCQVIAEMPAEPHDVGLNCIVTPTRWLEVSGRA
jgi:5-formyltetrahydrofolate cyclo-ligase